MVKELEPHVARLVRNGFYKDILRIVEDSSTAPTILDPLLKKKKWAKLMSEKIKEADADDYIGSFRFEHPRLSSKCKVGGFTWGVDKSDNSIIASAYQLAKHRLLGYMPGIRMSRHSLERLPERLGEIDRNALRSELMPLIVPVCFRVGTKTWQHQSKYAVKTPNGIGIVVVDYELGSNSAAVLKTWYGQNIVATNREYRDLEWEAFPLRVKLPDEGVTFTIDTPFTLFKPIQLTGGED